MTTRLVLVPAKPTATALLSQTEAFRDEDAPSSAPTILVEVALGSDALTALPAPPLVPDLGNVSARLPRPSPVPAFAPHELGNPFNGFVGPFSGSPTPQASLRPTVRVGRLHSMKLARMHRPTTPPTLPPPGSAPMRLAA